MHISSCKICINIIMGIRYYGCLSSILHGGTKSVIRLDDGALISDVDVEKNINWMTQTCHPYQSSYNKIFWSYIKVDQHWTSTMDVQSIIDSKKQITIIFFK